jgi:hypothetical protein
VSSAIQLSTGLSAAPAWCCAGSGSSIGVGGQNATLYVLSVGLSQLGAYQLGGAINHSPMADGAGDWFAAADDGNLYEVAAIQSGPYVPIVFGAGQFGIIGSGIQLGACGAWICAYLGSSSGGVYTVQLDARSAVVSVCISAAPPACSGENPRLWASVQVGSATSQQTVHVSSWSYYSP